MPSTRHEAFDESCWPGCAVSVEQLRESRSVQKYSQSCRVFTERLLVTKSERSPEDGRGERSPIVTKVRNQVKRETGSVRRLLVER